VIGTADRICGASRAEALAVDSLAAFSAALTAALERHIR